MKINPSEIKVDYGNGQTATLGSDANWERIRQYIDRLFQWDRSYPGDPIVPQEKAITEQSDVAAPPATLDPNLRIIDRIIIALGKSGGSLNNKETFRDMVADGYVNKAIKPENNIHSKVRKYPSLIKMDRGTFTLLPAGWELFSQLETNGFQSLLANVTEEASSESERHSSGPPAAASPRFTASDFSRESAISGTDYLLKAFVSETGRRGRLRPAPVAVPRRPAQRTAPPDVQT